MSEWKEYKLSDFIEINPKVTLKSGSKNSFVEMKDLSESQKFVLPSQLKEIKGGARFQNFDTLFARITPCLQNGKICQVKGLKNSIGFGSTEFLVFRGKEGISNTDFVYYLSRYDVVRKFAEQNMIGTSGRQRVSKDAFENIELLLPDLPTQTAIAEILSSLDDKIELNNKINQELETLAQTLFKQWFIDFEFPNENGEPYKSSGGEMVDSELGEIPKGWFVGKFGDLVNIINGYAFKSKDFNEFSTEGILKIRNINGTIVDIVNTDFVTTEVINKLNNKFKIESGEILIAMTGAEVGKIGVVAKTYKSLWLNQRVGKIMPKNNMHISYIHTMFNVLNFTDVVRNEAMGSAQPNISSQGIENIRCLMPEINLIDEFSSLHNDKFSLFYYSLAENQELKKLRDTLLPKLISGELEINETNN
jgi:type I restriction enzyme S subunit